ncbi:TonB-dependent receptor [Undibacterium sp. Di26W]|uniref:TonB-dependent receptor n=1 Tax=Undibacterium sp. Di26W TaxID=3413035 RepID=UPI003BEFE0A6
MKNSKFISVAATTGQRIVPKRVALALAGIGMLSLAPFGFSAETNAVEGEPAQVVVIGVRAAAESAQSIKKNSDLVIDSIVADDIGKFPDTNVAETIARVTGVQVRRSVGEANTVLIRGLPGIATTLNGREMFTTTGRYIQLADIPSAMLQRVDVYKAQSADLAEGGIAGLIDVRTNRPFDFKGFQASVNGGVVYKDKGKHTDPQFNGMVSNRWKTDIGEVGALFGVSHVKDRFFEEGSFQSFPIQKDWLLPNLTGPDLIGLLPVFGKRERTAENFAVQWRPNKGLELYAEGINSHYQNTDETDFLVGLPWWADTFSATKIPGTDQLDTLTSRNANTILSTQARHADNKTSQYAIGGRWQATPSLKVTTELARTASKYDWQNPILDTLINVPNVFIKTNVHDAAFAQYSGIDMANGNNVNLFQLFDRYGRDTGSSSDWRADATYIPDSEGFFKEFSVGVRYNKREADSIKSYEGSVMAPGYNGAWDASKTVKAGSISGMNCTAPTMSENYGTSGWYMPCASYLLNSTGSIRQIITGSSAAKGIDPGSFFSDTEKNVALYLKTKVGFDLGKMPVDGLLGVRVTKTDADLLGKSQVNGAYVDTKKSNSNTNVLPSASFKLALTDELIGRLAYAKTLTRPDFGQLNPGTAYVNSNGTTIQASASGGNPDLKPFTGQNLDAALEYYFARTGMVSATVFRHNFDGYIMSKSVPEVFQGVNYQTTRPYNSDKGQLQGLELASQQFFDRLPGWMSGLGMQANFTYMTGGVTSSVDPRLEGKQFTGMSKYSYNLVGLYERGPWSGRLAYNWRSKFTEVYGDRDGNAGVAPAHDRLVAPMTSLDGSLSYKINKDLSMFVTGTNLLNYKFRVYWDDSRVFPFVTRSSERAIALMLNWKVN